MTAEVTTSDKKFARFRFPAFEAFQRRDAPYQLLPFRFMRFDDCSLILVNESGENVFLDEATFQDFVGHRLASDTTAYYDLKAKHFVADDQSSPLLDVLATKYRTKKAFLSGFTKLHMFVTTLRCDHSCLYCQVSRQSEDRFAFDMNTETARKSVDLMLLSPAKNITLEFQGGESLLNFPLIQFIVEYSEHQNRVRGLGKKIDKVIATNLSKIT